MVIVLTMLALLAQGQRHQRNPMAIESSGGATTWPIESYGLPSGELIFANLRPPLEPIGATNGTHEWPALNRRPPPTAAATVSGSSHTWSRLEFAAGPRR